MSEPTKTTATATAPSKAAESKPATTQLRKHHLRWQEHEVVLDGLHFRDDKPTDVLVADSESLLARRDENGKAYLEAVK